MKKFTVIRLQFTVLSLVFYLFIGLFIYSFIPHAAHAALGNTRTINFQGRVVNKSDGTNVTDGTYSFTFKLYDAASSGNLLWQETQSSVTVTSGIFNVQLGSSTAFNGNPYNVNFNTSPLYLDITFNSETFGTRVQLGTVPYALNAETLDGVIATSSATGFTLTGGQSNSKTLTLNNSLGLSGTDGTTFTFPTTSAGTILTSNAPNTLTPTAAGVVGLTINGTNNTSTTADALDVNTIPATGLTATNGLLIQQNGAGTTTNGLQIQQSTGTLTNGLTFAGTFTKLINSTNFTVSNAGVITLVGNTAADIITTGTNTLKLDTAGAAGITLGGTNANAITLGRAGVTTTAGGNLTVNGTVESVGNGSSYTIQTSSNGALSLLASGTGNITLGQNSGVGNIVIQPNAGGQAALIVNDNTGVGDTFTASASGVTQFRITNSGAFLFQDSLLVASGSGSKGNGSGVSENALGDEGSLIPNAGFESAVTSAWGDGWFPAATTSANIFSRDISTPAKGGASLLATPANGTTVAIYSSCIPVAAGLGSYTLNYYAKASSASKMTIGAIVDTYSSKVNCQSDTTPSLTVVKASAAVTTSWAAYGSGTNGIVLPSNTWARLHFLFASTLASTTGEIDGVRFTEQSTGQGLDYAENYPTDASNAATAGDVVTLKPGGPLATVIPATLQMDPAIGVVSTNPGYVLDDGSITSPKVPIALSGRVPVKVSTQNGAIQLGDYLTASSIPGVAVKALYPGGVIGTALEDYSNSDPTQVGEVMMFVKNTYFDARGNGLIGAGTGITDMIGSPELHIAASSSASNIILSATKDLDSSLSAQNDSSLLSVNRLFINGLATVSADLRVKQNALVEGIFSVVDTIMANNFIANGLSDFFGNVVFHGAVAFQNPPTFSPDTAGYVVVKKGTDHVAIIFTKPYTSIPVVNAMIVSLTPTDDPQTTIFANGYSYVVTKITVNGFTLTLNKQAANDVTFSWNAIQILPSLTPGLSSSAQTSVAGSADISTAPTASNSSQ